MYTYMLEVRRKTFKLGKANAEFSQLPARMCFQETSLKAALSLAILSSETSFSHVKVEWSQYLKWQHDDKHRREWEIEALALYFNLFSFDACCWCHCRWNHYISAAEPLAGDSELVILRKKISDVVHYILWLSRDTSASLMESRASLLEELPGMGRYGNYQKNFNFVYSKL